MPSASTSIALPGRAGTTSCARRPGAALADFTCGLAVLLQPLVQASMSGGSTPGSMLGLPARPSHSAAKTSPAPRSMRTLKSNAEYCKDPLPSLPHLLEGNTNLGGPGGCTPPAGDSRQSLSCTASTAMDGHYRSLCRATSPPLLGQSALRRRRVSLPWLPHFCSRPKCRLGASRFAQFHHHHRITQAVYREFCPRCPEARLA